MKTMLIIAALGAVILAGCSQAPADSGATNPPATTSNSGTPTGAAVQVAYDQGSIKKGDKAHCVICISKGGGEGEETIAETIDYEGKTYAFCNEAEKADFISDPAKYAKK